MPKSFFTLLICLLHSAAHSQAKFIPHAEYLKRTSNAFNHFLNQQYKEAAFMYDSAFATSGGRAYALDQYYAAFSWAIAGSKEKAFYHLEKSAHDGRFSDLDKLLREGKFMKLANEVRWSNLLAAVKKNKEDAEAKLDRNIIARLDSIYSDDQGYRMQSDSIQKKYGWESKEMQNLWQLIRYKDSVNVIAIKEILDTKGWLGPEIIGEQGNSTLFLVIQHADSATQEYYLPLLKNAVNEGRAKPSQLALLIDRTRMKRGEKQLYGSQVVGDADTKKMKFYPIEDEQHVNERRFTVGLGSIEEYAKYYGIDYTLPKKK